MVVTPTCLAFRALITQARIWKRFWVKKLDKLTLFTHYSSVETWKIFRNILCFVWADILSEKNPYFGKYLFCKTKTDYAYKLRVQDFATSKNFSFNQCSYQERFAFFSRESYFIKAIENFFPVFAYPDNNTRGVDFVSGLHNCLEFSQPLSCLYQAMQTRKTFSVA